MQLDTVAVIDEDIFALGDGAVRVILEEAGMPKALQDMKRKEERTLCLDMSHAVAVRSAWYLSASQTLRHGLSGPQSPYACERKV